MHSPQVKTNAIGSSLFQTELGCVIESANLIMSIESPSANTLLLTDAVLFFAGTTGIGVTFTGQF